MRIKRMRSGPGRGLLQRQVLEDTMLLYIRRARLRPILGRSGRDVVIRKREAAPTTASPRSAVREACS